MGHDVYTRDNGLQSSGLQFADEPGNDKCIGKCTNTPVQDIYALCVYLCSVVCKAAYEQEYRGWEGIDSTVNTHGKGKRARWLAARLCTVSGGLTLELNPMRVSRWIDIHD